jgi:hypothetical protein
MKRRDEVEFSIVPIRRKKKMKTHVGFSVVLVAMLFAACSSQMPNQPSAVAHAAVAGMSTTASIHPSSANQQLIIQDRAGTGHGTFDGQQTPFGFWIWCQTVSSNAYGNDCGGAMYFYHLGISTGIDGSISGTTVTVHATPQNGSLSCTFTLPDLSTITVGATNMVTLTCASPSGSGTDTKVAIQLTPTS